MMRTCPIPAAAASSIYLSRRGWASSTRMARSISSGAICAAFCMAISLAPEVALALGRTLTRAEVHLLQLFENVLGLVRRPPDHVAGFVLRLLPHRPLHVRDLAHPGLILVPRRLGLAASAQSVPFRLARLLSAL